jgi:hypothetical protein
MDPSLVLQAWRAHLARSKKKARKAKDGGGIAGRARSHCRFVLPLIHLIQYSLTFRCLYF